MTSRRHRLSAVRISVYQSGVAQKTCPAFAVRGAVVLPVRRHQLIQPWVAQHHLCARLCCHPLGSNCHHGSRNGGGADCVGTTAASCPSGAASSRSPMAAFQPMADTAASEAESNHFPAKHRNIGSRYLFVPYHLLLRRRAGAAAAAPGLCVLARQTTGRCGHGEPSQSAAHHPMVVHGPGSHGLRGWQQGLWPGRIRRPTIARRPGPTVVPRCFSSSFMAYTPA